MLLVAAGCGGGSEGDDPVFPGNIVPLTATVNGQAAGGNMTLILAQSTPVSNVIAYQVNSFTLLNEQLRVTGTGFLSSDIGVAGAGFTIPSCRIDSGIVRNEGRNRA